MNEPTPQALIDAANAYEALFVPRCLANGHESRRRAQIQPVNGARRCVRTGGLR